MPCNNYISTYLQQLNSHTLTLIFFFFYSSVAQEASEVDGKVTNGSTANGTSSKNGGLFQRTISKIWRIPEGITGVAYSGIETPATPAAKKPAEEPVVDSTSKNGSCVIS